MTQDDREIRELLRRALPPVPPGGPEHNLAPRLRRRLDGAAVRATRWEWVAVLAAALWMALFPESIWALFVCL